MNTTFFKNKKVTVLGLGLHGGGVGTVKFLVSCGARVVVTDIKTREQLAPSLEKLKGLKNIEFILGQHRPEDFTKVDMVIKTPPVPWTDKNIRLALNANVPVEVDSSLFFKLCKNEIIGVTGTKGKTTTSTFIYDILKSAGKSVIKVGVGQASVLDKLTLLKKDTIVVFELSSWRLAALGRYKLSPRIAVFKNIFPDHLNYYRTMRDYVNDKKNIFLYQKPKDWLIVNHDDEIVSEAVKDAKSRIMRFSYSPLKKNPSVFLEGDYLYLDNGIDVKKVIAISEIKVPGKHNVSNVMAAMCACHAYGLTLSQIQKGIRMLKGVPHRLEFVRDYMGIRYFNDTASTIPNSAISAIQSFEQPVVLIAGGSDKGLDFSEMGKEVANKVKKTVLLKGNATENLLIKIRKNLKNPNEEFFVVESMKEAVELATKFAQKGDVVLLSPGAASFGLFNNEFDRGDQFRQAVKELG